MKLNSKKVIGFLLAFALSTSSLPILANENGWQQTNGVWSYLNDQGLVSKGWQLIDKSWYVFDTNGNMQTGWVAESENWYFLGGSGVMQSNTWIDNTDGSKYFVKGTGIMAADYIQDGYELLGDGKAVPLGSTGSVVLTDTSKLNGTTISGNLYVDAKTANDLIINGVTITGKLVILGDNESKTKITVVDSNINTISSQQRNSEIVLSGKTEIKNIVLQETASIVPDKTFKGQVEKFEIQSTTKAEVIVSIPTKEVSSRTYASVDIQAPVEKLEIKNDTNLKINADVSEIKVNASATGTKVEVNEGNTVGKIDTESKIEVSGQGKVDEVTGAGKDESTNVTAPDKPVTGGGGGGGGSTGPSTIDVTGVSLNETSKSFETVPEEAFDLIATVSPSNATNKKIEWTSSNEKVATVDKDGKVTIKAFGKATITATTINGSKTANCVVIVGKALASIVVEGETEVYVGSDLTLIATLNPEDASDTVVEWKSSDEAIATVSDTGVVTPKKAGTVNITAFNKAYGVTSDVKEIAVKQLVTNIEFKSSVESLLISESALLEVNIAPNDATSKGLTWTSSDGNIATVDKQGNVTAVALGQATIKATATDGSKFFAECNINVVNPVAKIDTTNYPTLEKALASAVSGQKVILTDKDYTMKNNAEIKVGVTLVLPYKESDTGYDVSKEYNPAWPSSTNTKYAEILTTASTELTIPEDTELKISGILIVNAETGIAAGGAYHPNSNHDKLFAQINLQGDITIENDGILECPGFIKGSGKITAENGATINDLMDIFNWRGGSYAYAMNDGKKTYAVYPIMESSISNIESEVILKGTAKFAGMAKIYAGSGYNNARFVQFGQTGLIQTNENTVITKEVTKPKNMDIKFDQEDYNYSTITIDGDATFASGEIKVAGQTVKTSDYFYPLSGTLTVNLKGNTFTVDNRMKMMKGSTINVGEKVKMIINNDFAIYKDFKDPYNVVGSKSVVDEDRAPAKLNLTNGSTLEINKGFAGEIYIDESCSSESNMAIIKTGQEFNTDVNVFAIESTKKGGIFNLFLVIDVAISIKPETYIVGAENVTLEPNTEYHCYYVDEELKVVVIKDGVIVPSNEEETVDEEIVEEEVGSTEENQQPEEEVTFPVIDKVLSVEE